MDEQDREDLEVGSLLRLAGARQPLPAATKARWEDHFRGELAAVQRERKRRWQRRALALCASVVAVAAGALLLRQTLVEPVSVTIEVVYASGDVTGSSGGVPLALAAGTVLSSPAELSALAGAYITLRYGTHELRLRENSRLDVRADRLWLHRGALYAADLPAVTPGGGGSLLIETGNGTVRDIGTQFTVTIAGEATEATVRRGAISVQRDGEERMVRAGPGEAWRSTLRTGEPIAVIPVASSGEEWAWIHRAAPPLRIDGRNALVFLEWAARESGRALRFASPAARRRAEQTILRGNLPAVDPWDAVTPILAATDLRADDGTAGELLVRVASP